MEVSEEGLDGKSESVVKQTKATESVETLNYLGDAASCITCDNTDLPYNCLNIPVHSIAFNEASTRRQDDKFNVVEETSTTTALTESEVEATMLFTNEGDKLDEFGNRTEILEEDEEESTSSLDSNEEDESVVPEATATKHMSTKQIFKKIVSSESMEGKGTITAASVANFFESVGKSNESDSFNATNAGDEDSENDIELRGVSFDSNAESSMEDFSPERSEANLKLSMFRDPGTRLVDIPEKDLAFFGSRIEPKFEVKQNIFKVSFNISHFDGKNISVCTVNDKIEVSATQYNESVYGSERHTMHQIFQIPKHVVEKDIKARITEDSCLLIYAPIDFSASKGPDSK